MITRPLTPVCPVIFLSALILLTPCSSNAASSAVLGWNNLGMHCMDSDYSVFSILPPYNVIEAQLIVGGKLVTNTTGYTVTYQAVADPDGSFNSTSRGKGNFYDFTAKIYGAVAVDQGLPVPGPETFWMPGTNNIPQATLFESSFNWFSAYGVPMSPYDDAGRKNPYPMMRLVARDANSNVLAMSAIVLPVSDEMDCRACHASGTQAAAKPAAGWVWSSNPERDYRLNILRMHDEKQFAQQPALYAEALAARSFNAQGLYRGVVADGKPVLCAACHLSEALPNTGYGTIPPLTASIHSFHATVMDPTLLITLDNSANRAACYRCHPGSTTKCLRGAMGAAVASDGSMEMQCQSCHGKMSQVGSTNRVGWLNEPNCQACHTGTAVQNSGQIRYTSAFVDANGTLRVPVNQTFATQPNTPAAGFSLFRFSSGHGGLQCEACHGSTHAEFPTTHQNDNLRNIALQGHAGVMAECTACHVTMPSTVTGGPHGMHPIGQTWVNQHGDMFESGGVTRTQCQVCHGTDYRGTVLSRAQADRQLVGVLTVQLFRGAEIGCYTCHNGPSSDSANTSVAPTVSNISANTTSGHSVAMTLPATGNTLTLRIISQPAHGSVGLSGTTATYFPDPVFVGSDSFTFAAYDGSKNSALGTGTITVTQGSFSISATALVPTNYSVGWPVPFSVVATPVNVVATPTFDWNFGDGTAHSINQYPTHTYTSTGTYNWSVISTVQSGATQASTTNTGSIVINGGVTLTPTLAGNSMTLNWPNTTPDVLIEESLSLGPNAHWTVVTNVVVTGGGNLSIVIENPTGSKFYRLRKL